MRTLLALTCFLLLASPSLAAPPANDGPTTPGVFEAVTAENGTPTEQQAIAELAEATPDPGVPACLGSSSFARTVWFRIGEHPAPRELTVEASGSTLAVLDLAAFVQPEGGFSVAEPNQCSGAGAGGADAGEEPTSAVSLRIPANRAVLIQVGRRGPAGSPDAERALLTLAQASLGAAPQPEGDNALAATFARGTGTTRVALGGATLTEEDPAQPPCPTLASVWRRITPSTTGSRTIAVDGRAVGALAVHAGEKPTGDDVLDCVVRQQRGELAMRVRTRRHVPLWIRVGTDRPNSASTALLRISRAEETIVDGGPGGVDPTPGGAGGGLPDVCGKARPSKARVTGARFAGVVKQLSRRSVLTLRVRLRGSSLCDVDARLVGPRGRVYAVAAAVRLNGSEKLRLIRTRRFARGGYHLVVRAIDAYGERRRVRASVTGRLR